MTDTVLNRTVALRPATDDDLPFLFSLYASTREQELAQLTWSGEQKEAFLRNQFESQHTWWHEQYEDTSYDVVLVDGEPAGRLYVGRWKETVRVVDIALMPEHRGSGIGTRLFRELFDEGDAAGKPVSIHVEIFNPARALYERLGFVVKEDKGVYLLMERPVPATA
ncbi:MAG TPA: GNAT family N-acetyltransferase [Longimicrobiaceae bacterium]|jgi:GNAT superfamily N-acetyltransferase|nr:GNAT family N-acetyltransferase [Longimicrobiaceae bacterium]